MDSRPDPIALYDNFVTSPLASSCSTTRCEQVAVRGSKNKSAEKREVATIVSRMKKVVIGGSIKSTGIKSNNDNDKAEPPPPVPVLVVQKMRSLDEDDRTNTTSVTIRTSGSDTASSSANSVGTTPSGDDRGRLCASKDDEAVASPQGDMTNYQNLADEDDGLVKYNEKAMIRSLLTGPSGEGSSVTVVDTYDDDSLSDSFDVIPLFMTDEDALDESSFARGIAGYFEGTEFPVICHTICRITEAGSEEALTDDESDNEDEEDDFDVMTREKWDALHSPQHMLSRKPSSRSQNIHRPKQEGVDSVSTMTSEQQVAPEGLIIVKCPSEPSVSKSNASTEALSRSASEGSEESHGSRNHRCSLEGSLPPSPRAPSPIKERMSTENTLPTIIDMMDEDLDGLLPEYKWREIEREVAQKQERPEGPFEPTLFEI